MTFRLLVCGSHKFGSYTDVARCLSTLARDRGWHDITLIHGGAKFIESFAGTWALLNKEIVKAIEVYPADWNRYGRSAGPIRNSEIIASKPDFCAAFPGGPGTADMVARCRRAHIPVLHIDPSDWTWRQTGLKSPRFAMNLGNPSPSPSTRRS